VSQPNLEAYQIASDLVACITRELESTPDGTPPDFDACVTPGSITWDNCCPGSIRASVQRQFPTQAFPEPILRPTACNAVQRVTEIKIVVLRCMPGPNADGEPPSCLQLDNKSQSIAADADAMWRGVDCCFQDTDFDYVIVSITAVGPDGQCVGNEMVLQVGLTNWCGCG
jgi:hypothetical protein